MRRLSAFAWRSLTARKLRTALTIGGVALGVAVLLGAVATNAGIDDSIDRSVAAMLGRADLRVDAFEEGGLSPASVQAIATTPGVAVVAPAIERRTYPQVRPGAGSELPEPVTVLGIDPLADPTVHDLDLASGVGLSQGLERSALLSESLARAEGLSLGDTITLQGAAVVDPQAFRIVGLVRGDGPIPDAGGRVAIMTLSAAKTLFATNGVTRVDVEVSPGAATAAVSAALEARLTHEPYVLSSAADLASSLRSSTGDFQSTMALVAAIALFVGAFLIFNTLSMTVGERVREVGLLRAAGTTSGQVNRLVLLQALVLGVAGSALGVAGGLGLAAALAAYVRSTGTIRLDTPAVSVAAIAVVFALGVLVTLAAALEPAWRAGRIPPIEALRARNSNVAAVRARLRWLVAVFVAVAIVGLVVWPRQAPIATSGGSGVGGDLLRPLAVYGLLLVAALASPLVLPALGRVVGMPFTLLARNEERLARSALVRDRSRTALTVGALTIGLAMIVAVGTVAQDARSAASAWLVDVIPGSEILTSIRPVAADEPQETEIAAVPGVERVSPIATFPVAFRGVRLDAAAVRGRDLLADGRLTFVSGDRTAALSSLDSGGTAIVSARQADRLGLRVGDAMSFATGSDAVTLRIVGIAERTVPGSSGETVVMGWPDAQRFGVSGAGLFVVRYAPGQEASARPAVDRIARGYALEPAPIDDVRGAVTDALGRIFGLFDVLALVAVVVAGLGIVNTLTMSVVERVREIGVLRATGMTRSQVSRMVVVEAALLGLTGAVLGCVAGLVVGAAMLAFAGQGVLAFELPWATILLSAGFGIVVAIAAAMYPARVASRVSIVRALQYE